MIYFYWRYDFTSLLYWMTSCETARPKKNTNLSSWNLFCSIIIAPNECVNGFKLLHHSAGKNLFGRNSLHFKFIDKYHQLRAEHNYIFSTWFRMLSVLIFIKKNSMIITAQIIIFVNVTIIWQHYIVFHSFPWQFYCSALNCESTKLWIYSIEIQENV